MNNNSEKVYNFRNAETIIIIIITINLNCHPFPATKFYFSTRIEWFCFNAESKSNLDNHVFIHIERYLCRYWILSNYWIIHFWHLAMPVGGSGLKTNTELNQLQKVHNLFRSRKFYIYGWFLINFRYFFPSFYLILWHIQSVNYSKII